MRLPKSVVASLIVVSFVSVLVTVLLWWTVWPRQTAEVFVAALANRDRDAVQGLLIPATQHEAVASAESLPGLVREPHPGIEWLARDAHDLLTGRQQFVIHSVPLTFAAQHGKVWAMRNRTAALALGEKAMFNLCEFASRISIDDPTAVDAKVNEASFSEVVLVGLKPSKGVNIEIQDRSGCKYAVKVTVHE